MISINHSDFPLSEYYFYIGNGANLPLYKLQVTIVYCNLQKCFKNYCKQNKWKNIDKIWNLWIKFKHQCMACIRKRFGIFSFKL